MIDRASTFAHPEIVEMLKNRFVPVAIDQAYQRRQNDREGEFYREIAGQGPRNDFQNTSQGFYAATNSGRLLFYNNNRNPDRLAGLMKEALRNDNSATLKTAPIEKGSAIDKRFNPLAPEGGLVVRVQAKVLGGYEAPKDEWSRIFQAALSRDNLWITESEHHALVRGEIPVELQRRIARFHLVDNTRGEPPMWEPGEIQSMIMNLESGRLTGEVKLQAAKGDREYAAKLFGIVESENGKVTRFDVVAEGPFRGCGPYTKNPPPGNFPLAISFTLADGADPADPIPPQGSRGWIDGYLR